MRPALKITVIPTLFLLPLAACSTVPKSTTLMSGLETAAQTKPAADDLRAPTDPVCVQFYKNAESYIAAANKPNPGRNFLTSLGVNVLAGVASGGIVPSGLGTVGQIAAHQAISTTVHQGSGMVLKGLNSNSTAGKKITDTAAELDCPLSLTT